ncbi:MAG: alkaline phosphatase family protein [Gemmatimonadota bacterium]
MLIRILFGLSLLGSQRPVQAADSVRATPTLVVFIAVDQMRGDYIERYQKEWRGGFRRIIHSATWYPNGLQDHAITETAPGHSTMLSGRNPGHVGIVTNQLGVPDPTTRLLEVAGTGASPRRIVGTEFFDWLKAADPAARVLSVSRKDRGAILPVGHSMGEVFWYASDRFSSSTYYFPDSLPSWVRAFNARPWAKALAGHRWSLLEPASHYLEVDDRNYENDGSNRTFPHKLPLTAHALALALPNYPWMDSLTAAFALEGVRSLKLGQGPHTDLLVVSFSATDYVGHAFGPDSREIHDQLLRLDRTIGRMEDSLARLVPGRRILYALTGDHGVTRFPEALVAEGKLGGRVSLASLVRGFNDSLQTRLGSDPHLSFESGLVMGDIAALRSGGIDPDTVAARLAVAARQLNGVRKVYTMRSLAQAPDSDVDASRWRRSLPDSLAWLVCASTNPGWIWSTEPGYTTHGTTNQDDVNVPIAFWGMGISRTRSSRAARTVDIAPTLAALIGIKPLEPLDGVPLPEVVTVPPLGRP